MTIEFITQDGTNRQHRIRLQALIGSIEGPLRIASAYVTDSQLLCSVSNRKVRLLTSLDRMNIISGATNLDCLRQLLEDGVHIKCLHNGPRLHAKVYILGNRQAVVSSANLTISGLERNVEVGVAIGGDSVRTLITWYEKTWNDAVVLDFKTLDIVEQETKAMRREYTKLRKKANRSPRSAIETAPSIRSKLELKKQLNSAHRHFVCNTNRKYNPLGEDEELMRSTSYAITWTTFQYTTHMEQVQKGDTIYMFKKGVGIIGIGRASSACEKLRPGDNRRVSPAFHTTEEWRIPVDDWIVWVESDSEAFSWTMPNASFLDVNNAKYDDFRSKVRSHFLPES